MICQGLGLDKPLGHGGVRFGGEWWVGLQFVGDVAMMGTRYCACLYMHAPTTPSAKRAFYFQVLTCESVHVCVYYCLS